MKLSAIIFIFLLRGLVAKGQAPVYSTLHVGNKEVRLNANSSFAPKSPMQYLNDVQSQKRSPYIQTHYDMTSYLNGVLYTNTVNKMLHQLYPLATDRMISRQSDFPIPYSITSPRK